MIARSRVLAALAIAAIALSSVALGGALLTSTGHTSSSPASAPAATSVPPAAHTPTASTASPTVSSHSLTAPGPAAEARLEATIKAAHVDLQKIYPPNLLYAPTMQHGMIVKPSYPEAPEPAGLADYGVLNSTGTAKSISFNTTSYRASLSLNSVLPYYLTTGVPEGFTSQLNVVMQNVTLFGNSSYNFWTQNVLFYDAYSNQMFIENNIWNFSAPPPAPQPTDTFLTNITGYTNGSDNPSVGYYAAGTQTFSAITLPLSVMFYINATTYNSAWGTNYTEVDFSFNLSYAGGAHYINDTYDRALFNNTGYFGMIPQAHFHIDGTNLTPTGFIPYDAEIMLGGPGGGSTATFYALNGTMTLQHWDATTHQFVNEPSAWSSGSETGETAVGVSDYYTADSTAHIGAGPEFVQPFWNSSATAVPGAAVLSGTITPSNAWAFATDGLTYNISDSAWGALPVSGNYSWNLTQGTYTVKLMQSDYDLSMSGALTLTAGDTTPYSAALTADPTMGVFTPLYALSNSQLAAISSGGTGTVADPYMIVNNEFGNLSGEFAATNDYEFPAYSGLSLWGTSAYVEIAGAASFQVDFWGTSLNTATYFGTPTSDDLAIWLFGTSHVTVTQSAIAGWTGPEQTGFPYADLVLWNATSTLVFANTFDTTDNAIFTYGGTGNAIVQNLFYNSPVPYATMTPIGYILPYGGLGIPGSIALIENEGGDTIWNNYFDTTFTALETNFNVYDDLYASVPETFTNNWNLSAPVQEGTQVGLPNGFSTGYDIGNYPYMCGNWWYDYLPGNTSLPYTEYVGISLIATGGDYCPVGSLGTLVFVESGLPTGTSWSVAVTGPVPTDPTLVGTHASLQTVVANGTYDYTVGAVTGYSAAPSSGGTVSVANGGVTTVNIVFTSTASTTGTLSGTVSPSTATVKVDGTAVTVTSGAFSMSASVGSHSIEALASGYYPYFNNVTVTSSTTTTVTIALNPVTPPVGADGTLSLTVTPASATVWVDGTQVTLTSGAYSASETPGVHSIEVTATGYYTYFNNVTVKTSATTTVPVALNPVTAPIGADGTLSLTVTTASATVWVDGTQVTLTSGAYSASVTPGVHSIEVTASGYYTYFNNVTVTSSTTTTASVTLNAVSSSSSSNNGISNDAWTIIAVLVALVVILLIATLIYMGRSRGGSGGKTTGNQGSS